MKQGITVTVIAVALVALGAGLTQRGETEPRLKEVFRDRFLIGAALNEDVVSGNDVKAANLVTAHCNTVTAENAMKWEHIHPAPDTYDFAPADRFVKFGEEHKMAIIGHTLIWQSQIPDWAFLDDAQALLSREPMLARMKSHISAVVGRYKGKVKGWDVVNEALSDDGKMLDTKWMRTIGTDFVEHAFRFAHEADPDAELYYNDFSLDKPAKRDAAVRLARDLRSKGLRIDAIGIQGHWGMDYPTRKDFDAFVESVKTVGLKVMVTELDLDILPTAWEYSGADVNVRVELQKELNPYTKGLPDDKQKAFADRYAELFAMLVEHSDDIPRVTFWGVYDKTSWLNNWPVRGRTSYPLLFDRDCKPKPAFFAVVNTASKKK